MIQYRVALALPLAALLGACADPAPSPTVIRPPLEGALGTPPPVADREDEPSTPAPDGDPAVLDAPPTTGQIGTTVASLGNAGEPGMWIETDLVSDARPGRIVNPETGQSTSVELRPAEGAGGGQLSIAAMRAIGAELTDLPTVEVYGD